MVRNALLFDILPHIAYPRLEVCFVTHRLIYHLLRSFTFKLKLRGIKQKAESNVETLYLQSSGKTSLAFSGLTHVVLTAGAFWQGPYFWFSWIWRSLPSTRTAISRKSHGSTNLKFRARGTSFACLIVPESLYSVMNSRANYLFCGRLYLNPLRSVLQVLALVAFLTADWRLTSIPESLHRLLPQNLTDFQYHVDNGLQSVASAFTFSDTDVTDFRDRAIKGSVCKRPRAVSVLGPCASIAIPG